MQIIIGDVGANGDQDWELMMAWCGDNPAIDFYRFILFNGIIIILFNCYSCYNIIYYVCLV